VSAGFRAYRVSLNGVTAAFGNRRAGWHPAPHALSLNYANLNSSVARPVLNLSFSRSKRISVARGTLAPLRLENSLGARVRTAPSALSRCERRRWSVDSLVGHTKIVAGQIGNGLSTAIERTTFRSTIWGYC